MAQAPFFQRAYLGAQGSASNYAVFYSGETSSRLIATKPLMIDAGFRFTSQWAIQVGWIGSKQTSRSSGEYINTNGKTTRYSTQDEQRNVVFPILVRYTVTHKPTHRLQFDVLAGITIVRATYHEPGTRFEDGQVAYAFDRANQAANALLTVGPNVRYALGSFVELISMGAINRNLHGRSSQSSVSPTISAGI